MISLLRNIRKSLLDEGKLLRYLTYVVGEVILIIVGILFALKINYWNEDRKTQEEFDLYVVQLKEDVRTAIDLARSLQDGAKERAVQAHSIIYFLDRSEFNSEELAAFEGRGYTSGQ